MTVSDPLPTQAQASMTGHASPALETQADGTENQVTSFPDQFSIALFAYGTLRQSNVQMATFGRLVEGSPDALNGHVLAPLAILDPYVVEASGFAVHSAARYTGNPADIVHGTVYGLSAEELHAADEYEVKEMMRVEATLVSGVRAFVYVRAPAASERPMLD